MLLVAFIVVVIWVALLALVVAAIHVATSSPTPQPVARPSLVRRSDMLPEGELLGTRAA